LTFCHPILLCMITYQHCWRCSNTMLPSTMWHQEVSFFIFFCVSKSALNTIETNKITCQGTHTSQHCWNFSYGVQKTFREINPLHKNNELTLVVNWTSKIDNQGETLRTMIWKTIPTQAHCQIMHNDLEK
jgi:hypothetical protein